MNFHFTPPMPFCRPLIRWVYVFQDEVPKFLGRVWKERDNTWSAQTMPQWRVSQVCELEYEPGFASRSKAAAYLWRIQKEIENGQPA